MEQREPVLHEKASRAGRNGLTAERLFMASCRWLCTRGTICPNLPTRRKICAQASAEDINKLHQCLNLEFQAGNILDPLWENDYQDENQSVVFVILKSSGTTASV